MWRRFFHLRNASRTAVALVALTTSSSSANEAADLTREYRGVSERLAATTRVPIVLPARLPTSRDPVFVQVIVAAKAMYAINIVSGPDCDTRNDCSRNVYVLGRARPNARSGRPRGRKVRLVNGTPAYWATRQCAYLGCGYNALTYGEGGYVYVVAVENGSLRDVLLVANAMTLLAPRSLAK